MLACFQLFTAAWIFRKLPWTKPAWVNPVIGGRGGSRSRFTLPVAYHCIFKLGFQDPDARVLAHSLLGCAVYGAFAAKVTILRLHRFPTPVLPVAGGLLFATLIGVWYTSALWLYRQPPPAPPPRPVRFPQPRAPRRARPCSSPPAVVLCHTLAAAGSQGQIGPNLDSLRPSFAAVQHRSSGAAAGCPRSPRN